ncbi:MAG TPA: succinate dehydrogenase, hydrophobic membrane anchor protein [Casimicrobiaceae bacterium]|nr:succinate dehydrogenase, hydrophobic membrane anchor protein [Casimicrobiaceae bacterium]
MVARIIVGAHYGWKDWLAQRATAVVMALYTLLLLGIALYQGGIDYATWTALFAHPVFRIATLLFGLALFWHAWIGMRDIWMDYVKPAGLRLTLEVLTVIVLVGYVAWLVEVLWGPGR